MRRIGFGMLHAAVHRADWHHQDQRRERGEGTVKRWLVALAALMASTVSGWTCDTQRSGLWSDASTWFAGACTSRPPLATEVVNILANHTVILDEAASCASGSSNCAIGVSIAATGGLITGRGAGVMRIDCTNGSTPSPCVSVSGTMAVGPRWTVKIIPDTAGNSNTTDNITVNSGGRLVARGASLAAGTITGVTTDENLITNPVKGFGLPRQDFAFTDAKARLPMVVGGAGSWASGDSCVDNCYIVRFTSGERRWRWYNIDSHTNKGITVDFDSRGNPACTTGNEDTCTNAFGPTRVNPGGTITVTNGTATVTGSGAAFAGDDLRGSRFYCSTGGTPANQRRVVKVDQDTQTLTLDANYTGTTCTGSSTYVVMDDNQPWPFFDHSERIATGDGYEVIAPATIQGAATGGAEPDGTSWTPQTQIICEAGARCDFTYATLKWIGRGNYGFYAKDGTQAKWFDSEYANFGGVGGVWLEKQASGEFARNFLHLSHPLVPPESGHGAVWANDIDVTPSQVSGLTIHDNRMELTNDAPVWVKQPTSGAKITKNVIKYIPNTATGQSAHAIAPHAGATVPSTSTYHSDMLIASNEMMNFGGDSGSECTGWSLQTGKTFTITFAQNVCANVQEGNGIWFRNDSGLGTETDYAGSRGVAVGNLVTHTEAGGINGIHVTLNNVVMNWGLNRYNDERGGGITHPTREARGNILIPTDENVATVGGDLRYGIHVVRKDYFAYQTALKYDATVTISDNAIYGHGIMARIGDSTIGAIQGNPDFTFTNNLFDCSMSRDGVLPNTKGINMEQPVGRSVTATGNIFIGCQGAAIQRDSGTLVENNNLFYGNVAAASGFSPDGTDTYGPPPLMHSLSFILDRTRDATATHGPRSVGLGTLAATLSGFFPRALLAGTTSANSLDSDGDGVSNFFDNCDFVSNPGQSDGNGDGRGDACP